MVCHKTSDRLIPNEDLFLKSLTSKLITYFIDSFTSGN